MALHVAEDEQLDYCNWGYYISVQLEPATGGVESNCIKLRRLKAAPAFAIFQVQTEQYSFKSHYCTVTLQ
jgi:hypothetical protein